jgi:S1-C subfamily serine protease
MRYVKWTAILAVLIGGVPAAWTAAWASEQDWRTRGRRLEMLAGPQSEIGVSVRNVTADDVERAKLDSEAGAVIEKVRPGGPAARAGVREGDIVTGFDGERVRSAEQFSRLVRETPDGRTVVATLIRGTERLTVNVAPEAGADQFARLGRDLEERFNTDEFRRNFRFDIPSIPDFDVHVQTRPGRLGVSVSDLDPQLADYFGARGGVLVTSVRPDSPAAKAGVKAGDVVTRVNGRPIDGPADLRRGIGDVDDAADVTLTIVRDKKEQTLKVTLERAERRPGRPI